MFCSAATEPDPMKSHPESAPKQGLSLRPRRSRRTAAMPARYRSAGFPTVRPAMRRTYPANRRLTAPSRNRRIRIRPLPIRRRIAGPRSVSQPRIARFPSAGAFRYPSAATNEKSSRQGNWPAARIRSSVLRAENGIRTYSVSVLYINMLRLIVRFRIIDSLRLPYASMLFHTA